MKAGARVFTARFERSASTGVWKATAHTSEGELTAEGCSIREARLALERVLDPTAPQDDGEDDFDIPQLCAGRAARHARVPSMSCSHACAGTR